MAKDEKQNERQRALYMTDKSYKRACLNAEKHGCSFSKYINLLEETYDIETNVKLIKK